MGSLATTAQHPAEGVLSWELPQKSACVMDATRSDKKDGMLPKILGAELCGHVSDCTDISRFWQRGSGNAKFSLLFSRSFRGREAEEGVLINCKNKVPPLATGISINLFHNRITQHYEKEGKN